MSDKEVAPEWVGGSYTGDLNPRILQVLKILGRHRLVLQPSSWMFLPTLMFLFSGNQNPRFSVDLNPWFLQELEMLDYLELVLLSSIIHRMHLTSFDAFVFRELKSPNFWGFKPPILKELEMLGYLELLLLPSIIHRKCLTGFATFIFKELKSLNFWEFKSPKLCKNKKCSIIKNWSHNCHLFIVCFLTSSIFRESKSPDFRRFKPPVLHELKILDFHVLILTTVRSLKVFTNLRYSDFKRIKKPRISGEINSRFQHWKTIDLRHRFHEWQFLTEYRC